MLGFFRLFYLPPVLRHSFDVVLYHVFTFICTGSLTFLHFVNELKIALLPYVMLRTKKLLRHFSYWINICLWYLLYFTYFIYIVSSLVVTAVTAILPGSLQKKTRQHTRSIKYISSKEIRSNKIKIHHSKPRAKAFDSVMKTGGWNSSLLNTYFSLTFLLYIKYESHSHSHSHSHTICYMQIKLISFLKNCVP